jgi:integrase
MSVYRPKYRDPKTGKTKQQKVWWYHFTFAGRHIQESSKSTRKTIATDAEKKRRLELEQAYAGIPTEKPKQRIRTVHVALSEYQTRYGVNHRAKSVAWVKERASHVERILGGLLLPDLTEDCMTGYMAQRLKEGAGNRTINMELECLARAIGQKWHICWPKLKRLEESRDAGQALSTEDEHKLLEHAAKNRSPLVLPFIRIALLTGMRFGEIRSLRWNQIDLDSRTLTVGKAKTPAGTGRPIPMSSDLYSTFAAHAGWLARKLGPIDPSWYVFPFSNRVRPVDPTRPVTTIKSSWESVREDAGVECRFHDLRHTAYTKMVEAGVPEGIIMALMGHVSRAMVERYSHVRMDAMRKAVTALSLEKPKPEPENQAESAKESAKVTESVTIQ